MTDVYVLGCGQVPVSKSPRLGRHLAADAVAAAIADAGCEAPTALYVGNMMSGILSDQQQLGALVADAAGLRGIEAMTAEAACASGAAAMRLGTMAVASGMHATVVVCGVEKMSHTPKDKTTAALATASDWTYEGGCGASFLSLNAQLMSAYMAKHKVGAEVFAPFSVNAHQNARTNPNALFHKDVTVDTYMASREIVPPVRLYDASPICDGAAALVLGDKRAAEAARRRGAPVVKVIGSGVATDSLGLRGRTSLLRLDAANASAKRAFRQAGVGPDDVDLFEVHDAYTIITVLSLEAAGFAPPGGGYRLGLDDAIKLGGRLPLTTMGGLKARGHPVGATGTYQLAEAYLQLAQRAGANQVSGAKVAMAQNIGGTGATVITHLLRRVA